MALHRRVSQHEQSASVTTEQPIDGAKENTCHVVRGLLITNENGKFI
jgi:hypothetical protein